MTGAQPAGHGARPGGHQPAAKGVAAKGAAIKAAIKGAKAGCGGERLPLGLAAGDGRSPSRGQAGRVDTWIVVTVPVGAGP